MEECVISMKKKIEDKISELECHRNSIQGASEFKAEKKAQYAKDLAIAILKLRNKVIVEFEGQKIDNLPANLIPKVAEGICWESCLENEKAESGYKGLIVQLDSLKAELNGLQSLNRHLD